MKHACASPDFAEFFRNRSGIISEARADENIVNTDNTMAEMQKNRESITLPLVLPLALALVLSLAASLYGMRWVQQQNTNQRLYDESLHGQQLFRSLLATQVKQLQKRIEILQADSALQEAFLARDGSRLQEALSHLGPKVVVASGMGPLFFDAERKLVFSADHLPLRVRCRNTRHSGRLPERTRWPMVWNSKRMAGFSCGLWFPGAWQTVARAMWR